MHVRSVHNDLWFECKDCNFKASQKSNLKTHIQIHHEGMVHYRCDQCSYKASKKQNFDKHMEENVHLKKRPKQQTQSKHDGSKLPLTN